MSRTSPPGGERASKLNSNVRSVEVQMDYWHSVTPLSHVGLAQLAGGNS